MVCVSLLGILGWQGNACIFIISQRNVEILYALGSGSLKEIVNGGTDDHSLARAVHTESTNRDMVLFTDVLHQWNISRHFNQLLPRVTVLEDVANVSSSHRFAQRNIDSTCNSLEPLSDMWDKGYRFSKMSGYFLLVKMTDEGVRHQIVCKLVDVIFGRWFGTGSGVT